MMILKHILIGATIGAIFATCLCLLFRPLPETPMINALLLGAFELIAIYKLIKGYITGRAELKLLDASIDSNPKMYNRIQEWWWIIIFFIPALGMLGKVLH